MATEAQIESNRRNSQKSTGPRSEAGKNRSKFNALDHGCRANILILPTEDFGEYEQEANAWKLSWQPRNSVEEFLVDRIVNLSWQAKRIDQAQTARLATRILRGEVEAADCDQETVLELGQRLFREACGPGALWLQHKVAESSGDEEVPRISDYSVDEDHPRRLVNRLQATGTGCQWLLDQWAVLRDLLERGVPWLAPDKLKAVRLLGRHPIDAIDCLDVARVYLASHVLLNQEGDPFQEIMNELAPESSSGLCELFAAASLRGAGTHRCRRRATDAPRPRGSDFLGENALFWTCRRSSIVRTSGIGRCGLASID
jgi:hypothetical protein